jgi:hypothetical protein
MRKVARNERIAGLFLLMFSFFIILGLFSTSGFDRISASFKSMYEDRLIPSLDISNLVFRVYENRVVLENHITSDDITERNSYQLQLTRNQKSIDSLILHISNTYLVPEEKADLGKFKRALNIYRVEEKSILKLSYEHKADSALQILTHQGDMLFHAAVIMLRKLGKDQQMVGEELYNESQSIAKMQKQIAYSMMILAAFAGITLAFWLTIKKMEVE